MADNSTPNVTVPEVTKVPTPSVKGTWSVEEAIKQIPTGVPKTDSSSPLPFYHFLERLKTTKREGWRRFGINSGESIADHMYRMSIITLVCPPALAETLDIPRCMKMALVHDMAESLVGDITPVDGVPKPEKSRRETDTMAYISTSLLGNFGGGLAGKELSEVWHEYEHGKTKESVFVHDVDKLELLLQMVEYERRGEGKLDLGEFAYVATRVELPEMREMAEQVVKEREDFWSGRAHSQPEDTGEEKTQMLKEYYDKEEDLVKTQG